MLSGRTLLKSQVSVPARWELGDFNLPDDSQLELGCSHKTSNNILSLCATPEMSIAGTKKSSFLSSHSLAGEGGHTGLLFQSLVSMPSEIGFIDVDTEGKY